MMRTNLLPAILLAGAPHCGKSVLSYLLTQELRRRGVHHYLLRTAPDGEGDWFLEGSPETVRILRMANKGSYTAELVAHMRQAIHERRLPLLVDIGGKPQGDQFDILAACTHYILLYKTEEERTQWLAEMTRLDLLPVAELCSTLTDEERAELTPEGLQGIMRGLVRENPQPGATFNALITQVEGIFQYDPARLEQEHLKEAPYPVVLERELAVKVQASPRLPNPWWEPDDLPGVLENVPKGQPLALYGRGPVWLAAALAVQAFPAPTTLFDARYGWLSLPEVVAGETPLLNVVTEGASHNAFEWVIVNIKGQVLEPQAQLVFPERKGERGVVLSGQMPRWLFAALAGKLVEERPWVAIHVPRFNHACVIFSRVAERKVGDTLQVAPIPEDALPDQQA